LDDRAQPRRGARRRHSRDQRAGPRHDDHVHVTARVNTKDTKDTKDTKGRTVLSWCPSCPLCRQIEAIKERDMDTIWQDIRYAIRTLVKTPAFALAAILSLALGIGANTTIFTLLNTLFLNPLPVTRPSELVAVLTLASRNATQFGNLLPLSYPNLKDFRARNAVLTDLAGYSPVLALSLSTSQQVERVFAQLVTGNYFDLLGV